jgi:DNA-directed RNA polymerase specialized sigma24 family protein
MVEPLQEKALRLHQRLLSGDPRAPSEIFELFEKSLSAVVRKNVPKLVDPGDLNIAVADALLKYFRDPSIYDPSQSALFTWLCNQARYNALSLLREHRQRQSKIEEFGDAVRIGLVGADNKRSDAEKDFLDAIEVAQIMDRYGSEIVKDDSDLEVFLLMAAGVKDERIFAQALGLSASHADTRFVIRRKRDAIRKRLERFRKKMDSTLPLKNAGESSE